MAVSAAQHAREIAALSLSHNTSNLVPAPLSSPPPSPQPAWHLRVPNRYESEAQWAYGYFIPVDPVRTTADPATQRTAFVPTGVAAASGVDPSLFVNLSAGHQDVLADGTQTDGGLTGLRSEAEALRLARERREARRAALDARAQSRFLANGAVARSQKRPAFHPYGSGNVTPLADRDHLASYNINPLRHPVNGPKGRWLIGGARSVVRESAVVAVQVTARTEARARSAAEAGAPLPPGSPRLRSASPPRVGHEAAAAFSGSPTARGSRPLLLDRACSKAAAALRAEVDAEAALRRERRAALGMNEEIPRAPTPTPQRQQQRQRPSSASASHVPRRTAEQQRSVDGQRVPGRPTLSVTAATQTPQPAAPPPPVPPLVVRQQQQQPPTQQQQQQQPVFQPPSSQPQASPPVPWGAAGASQWPQQDLALQQQYPAYPYAQLQAQQQPALPRPPPAHRSAVSADPSAAYRLQAAAAETRAQARFLRARGQDSSGVRVQLTWEEGDGGAAAAATAGGEGAGQRYAAQWQQQQQQYAAPSVPGLPMHALRLDAVPGGFAAQPPPLPPPQLSAFPAAPGPSRHGGRAQAAAAGVGLPSAPFVPYSHPERDPMSYKFLPPRWTAAIPPAGMPTAQAQARGAAHAPDAQTSVAELLHEFD